MASAAMPVGLFALAILAAAFVPLAFIPLTVALSAAVAASLVVAEHSLPVVFSWDGGLMLEAREVDLLDGRSRT